MIDDAVNEECDIGHEFAHPRRIRSLIDGPLQDVGFSDTFEKVVKILAVGDETGFVQVSSTAIARGVIVLISIRVLVPQYEPVTEVNLEGVGLFLVRSKASLERSCLAWLICNRTCTGEVLSIRVSLWSTSALERHLAVPSTGCRRREVERVDRRDLRR